MAARKRLGLQAERARQPSEDAQGELMERLDVICDYRDALLELRWEVL